MGGGFGGKETQGNALAVACAVAAERTGRPARMRYDRDDDMVVTGKRHPFRIDYRAGYDATGRLAGVDFEQFANCGWAQDLSCPVADRAMLHADNAYFLPQMRITSHRLKTNVCSFTAFRGFGGPQGMLGIERVVDHVAARSSSIRSTCGGRTSTPPPRPSKAGAGHRAPPLGAAFPRGGAGPTTPLPTGWRSLTSSCPS